MENIEMIKTNLIYPHPDNPRKDLGDLTELAESIRQNGIYQNLTVVPRAEGGYTAIIGHRRLAAAKLAGMKKIPCVIVEMSPQKQVETMLLENMQRADLTLLEQVRGFQQLLDFGDSIKDIAQKTGFSERTVRRRTEIARLDPKALDKVMKNRGRQLTLEDFEMLQKIDDINERNRLLNDIGTNGFKYMLEQAERRQENNKAMPAVKAWLEEHKAIELIDKEYVWRDYLRTDGMGWSGLPLQDFDEKKNDLESHLPAEKLYYLISDTGNLSLYVKKTETQNETGKQTEITPEEAKRQGRIKAAWEYLEEQAKIMYGLRKEFIQKLKVTAKNKTEILKGILIWFCVDGAGVDFDGLLEEALELKDDWSKDMSDLDMMKFVDDLEDSKLARVVYGLFEDNEDNIPVRNSWRRDTAFPQYNTNSDLPFLYHWLEGLGYEVSNIERELMDGTDPRYHLDDTEAEK